MDRPAFERRPASVRPLPTMLGCEWVTLKSFMHRLVFYPSILLHRPLADASAGEGSLWDLTAEQYARPSRAYLMLMPPQGVRVVDGGANYHAGRAAYHGGGTGIETQYQQPTKQRKDATSVAELVRVPASPSLGENRRVLAVQAS
ncbi:hypothetical protein ED733_008640 [Metarhizium rileyi]|uniref:Uncharacterized protein n=1 Tax=Metarhizium rileyi (strain RCEF 4871) TaxID=1649241 RepID=A0A5C6GLU3_METRR|nr:hypothetical protein ED733_008640 [Metarhizium rileyi]